VPLEKVIDRPGLYRAEGGKMCVMLFSGRGEVFELRSIVPGKRPQRGTAVPSAYDTTSFAWVTPTQVLFATSTVYGSDAGIFLYDLDSRGAKKIRLPPVPPGLSVGWIKLETVSPTSLTCWFADISLLRGDDLPNTATRITFHWSPVTNP
ncbi:MAG: hypothetical protein ACM3JH_05270, partial [Acidithiobacillales bacterium]